jgi:succinyl-diaminopimelate desuccinylase
VATTVDPGDPATLQAQEMFATPFLAQILRSLVQTVSVNPGVSESAVAAKVVDWLEPTAAQPTLVESLPGRLSVAAVLGSGKSPRLVLNGHTDTVPIDDPALWTTDPFSGEVRDGYLYGRGACDMKGGLAVQIAVAHFLTRYVDRMVGTLVLHFAMGEERGEPGTKSLLQAGFGGDYGVTTEPTQLGVATATRGAAYYNIRIKGRSIHASRAKQGVNPILWIPAVLGVLREYGDEIELREHRLLPGGSCTPTMLAAGVKENAVPDVCVLTLDRRLLPGETPADEMEAIRARLDEIKKDDPEFDFDVETIIAVDSAEIEPDSRFVTQVLRATEAVGVKSQICGAPFGSDVRDLVGNGIDALTFGPGNVAECHCPDERVSLDEVRNAALVIGRLSTELLLEQ